MCNKWLQTTLLLQVVLSLLLVRSEFIFGCYMSQKIYLQQICPILYPVNPFLVNQPPTLAAWEK